MNIAVLEIDENSVTALKQSLFPLKGVTIGQVSLPPPERCGLFLNCHREEPWSSLVHKVMEDTVENSLAI